MVKIKLNMTIPKSCTQYPFYVGMNYGKCIIDEALWSRHSEEMRNYEYDRPEWCPLKEK